MKDIEYRRVRREGDSVESSDQVRLGGRQRLGEFLHKAGLVTEDDIERALAMQRTRGGRLGSILVNLRICREEDIRQALRDQLGVDVVNLGEIVPNPDLLELVSLDLIRKYEVIPLRLEPRKLWIAMMDPYNLVALEDIRFHTGIPRLIVTACTERDFKRFIEEHLESRALFDEILRGRDFFDRALSYLRETQAGELEEETPEQAHELRVATTESPIVTLCNFIVMEAIRRRASDIHLEPHETSFRVRLRIDGRLQTILNPPKRLNAAVTARFKVMSELDITKRRIPQDGHLMVNFHGETIHFRVSTLPTIYGEKCVIRLLRKDHALVDLENLGMNPLDIVLFSRMIKAPQGLILTTGPTGSGKSSTLHAGMAYINNPEINVVTLEDPVETTLTGVNHVPTSKIGGVSFADGLRSILRQDPDVIFIGEIRDTEVASIAFRAAQTGHLVLSTLHTNSAVESIVRLSDLGVPPYLIAGSLLLVIAQRLVRRVCEQCAEPDEPAEEILTALRIAPARLVDARLRRGRGCSVCMHTGYSGRLAVYEMIRMTRELRELIRCQAGQRQIEEYVAAMGRPTLLDAAVERALRGETTLGEVQRVLFVEE